MKNHYKVIGLMSGTSLDGVDIAYCEFDFNNVWKFRLLQAETISYDSVWKKNLSEIHHGSSELISQMDCDYGSYLGRLINEFCKRNNLSPDFISSHGHTIFHQPVKSFTRQIGSGAHISAIAGFPVVCDFRSGDVALGGQGAPLVPIGDKYLFPEADYCLNLGGIANISFDEKGDRHAFDICACNLVLNHYSLKLGQPFDKNGEIAATGKINLSLLDKLNSLPYYKKPYPKSLGREDVESDLIPLIDSSEKNIENILSTFCEHISIQIGKVVSDKNKNQKMLVTGGGTLNSFLVNSISNNSNVEIIIPPKEIIEFKEAIIFAFLGVLRIRNEINCLKSVTGAKKDSCGGAIYHALD